MHVLLKNKIICRHFILCWVLAIWSVCMGGIFSGGSRGGALHIQDIHFTRHASLLTGLFSAEDYGIQRR